MSQAPIKISTAKQTTPHVEHEDNEDLTSQPTEDPDVRQRHIYIRAENKWKHTNLALVRGWKVIKMPNMIGATLSIDGVQVKPTKETNTTFDFDFRQLRAKWVDLLGMTPAECDMIALEETITLNQLTAMQHYKMVTLPKLRGAIFTQNLDIIFAFEYKQRTNAFPKVEVIEEYYISDIHKQTYATPKK